MQSLDYDYIAKLVQKTKEGDSDAFAELYTATYQQQYRTAYRFVRDQHQAQDIIQDVYIIVLKNIDSFKNPRLFISWLGQINFRVCYDYTKKAKRRGEQFMPTDEMSYFASSDSVEDAVVDGILHSELQDYILSLPPKQSQAIIMKYFNNMTLEEIADAMNLSKSTIKRELAKARDTLRKLVENGRKEVSAANEK